MESTGSSSSPPHHHHYRRRPNQPLNTPTQPFVDRVLRAIEHRLRLLHRSDSQFFVLGATGNVYTVTISDTPSCTCPDRTTPCKHILFVLIRVLGVPLDDSCLSRRILRPCQLDRLLALPILTESLAGTNIRQRFHQLFVQERQGFGPPPNLKIEEGTTCPICLEEMGMGAEKVVACAACRNPIHEECLMGWKRSSRRRSVRCVICRARWRTEQEKYLNLSAYISHDDEMAEAAGETSCGS